MRWKDTTASRMLHGPEAGVYTFSVKCQIACVLGSDSHIKSLGQIPLLPLHLLQPFKNVKAVFTKGQIEAGGPCLLSPNVSYPLICGDREFWPQLCFQGELHSYSIQVRSNGEQCWLIGAAWRYFHCSDLVQAHVSSGCFPESRAFGHKSLSAGVCPSLGNAHSCGRDGLLLPI